MSKANRSPFKLDTDLLSLRTLVAVVEEGGFSAAANRVHRTQSAISLQIAKLEERLNTKLLERTSRSLSLTPAGETFLSYARRILELADESMLALSAPEEGSLLRVGFAEYLAPQHLHSVLARFRRAHPNCELRLVLGLGGEMLDALDRGELDVVFSGPDRDGGQVLWQEPLVWTGHDKFGDDDEIELLLFPAPCIYRKIAFDALTKAGRTWKVALNANSTQAIQSAVRAGMGIGILPASSVLDDMPVIEAGMPKLSNTYLVSYTAPDLSNPYASRFTDFLLACIEDSLGKSIIFLDRGKAEVSGKPGRRKTRSQEKA
ncbi:LysR family transcriptional regulator [Haloferula chungangensis]|uniref:LysR family transcriptional regulator n=1 Tax=Haloferula chungangensis TaxID=1048331 RepID=A0ABW2L8C9_9BACT